MERLHRIPDKHWLGPRNCLKNRLNAVIHNSILPKITEIRASETLINLPTPASSMLKPELCCRANTDM
jgi:hypothetical protein